MCNPVVVVALVVTLGNLPTSWMQQDVSLSSDDAPVNARIEQSLELIQSSEATWRKKRSCASCHHQLLGAVTLAVARERGFSIDETRFASHVGALQFPRIDGHLVGEGGANPQISHSYLLFALAALQRTPDSMTDSVVHLLEQKQHESGSWRSLSYRAPIEASEFTATALALRGLQHYAPLARRPAMQRRVERAATWLEEGRPFTTEEHAMRLFGLAWAERDVSTAAMNLMEMQHEDGGWAQLATRSSDAYATGQVLVALNQAAGMEWSAPALQRGIRWLLDNSEGDGSWRVPTRRKLPGLPYFETGFPHGEDQFISCAATCWSTMALMLSRRPGRSTSLMGAPARHGSGWSPAPKYAALSPLFQTVVSGTTEELRRQIEDGADVNQTNEAGATPLMAAMSEPAKVRLLLDHGADVRATAKNHASALSMAAALGNLQMLELLLETAIWDKESLGVALFSAVESEGDTTVIRKFLELGADPNLEGPEGVPILHLTCLTNDAEVTRLLLAHGSQIDAKLTNFDGITPLIIAVVAGRTDIVRLLLKAGADVEIRDALGRTALHWASVVDPGHTHALESLLEEVVDVDPLDDAGENPLQLARRHGNHGAVRILEAAGGE